MSCAVPGFALGVVGPSDVLWVPVASPLHFFSRTYVINCWWPKCAGNTMCTGYHAGGLGEKQNKASARSSHSLFTFSQANGKLVPLSLLLSDLRISQLAQGCVCKWGCSCVAWLCKSYSCAYLGLKRKLREVCGTSVINVTFFLVSYTSAEMTGAPHLTMMNYLQQTDSHLSCGTICHKDHILS